MLLDAAPSPGPSRVKYLETNISESSAKWLQAIKAGEYWKAKAHARNCLNACALLYGDHSSQLSPALYAYAVTILYKERVERRNSFNTELSDVHLGGVAGGSSSKNRRPGWPGQERAQSLNFEGIEYCEMTDTDLALGCLGKARCSLGRKLQHFPRIEVLEAIGDLYFERGDLEFADDYYHETAGAWGSVNDPCFLQRAVLNFKYCLVLVGSNKRKEAHKRWSDGISFGKSALNNYLDGKDSEQGMVQRSLLSDLEQMEDLFQMLGKGLSYVEAILKKFIKNLCELIDIYSLEKMGLRVKQATFIPGEDVQVHPGPESVAIEKEEDDWMRRVLNPVPLRKRRMTGSGLGE